MMMIADQRLFFTLSANVLNSGIALGLLAQYINHVEQYKCTFTTTLLHLQNPPGPFVHF